MNYFNRPVFEFPINWSRRPSGRFEYDLRELQIGFGPEVFDPLQSHVVHGFQFSVLLLTESDIAALDDFFDLLNGRLQGFWLPGPQSFFQIANAVSATQFDIAAQGLTDTLADHPAQYVWFTKDGQASQPAKILAVVDNGNGTERITLDAPLNPVVDQTWNAVCLHYVRLASDEESGEFEDEGRMTRSLRVVELPTEYAAVETGQKPLFLYHFWIDLGGPLLEWRLTSFAGGIVSQGNTYTPAPIQHGSITHAVTADRAETTIEAAYEETNPLSLLCPVRLSRPLWVEILETTLLDLNTTTTLFTGRVMPGSLKGKRMSASCTSILDSLRGSVPGMWIQPRCNYRVYEPNTCRVNQASFECAVTITNINGLEVTVSGAAIAGKGANWFAEGWIQTGTGSSYEERTILSSTAESGGSLKITVNVPLSFALLNQAAVIVAGCDGSDVHCLTKFNNFVNNGAHRIPNKNLTLKAIENETSGAGKK